MNKPITTQTYGQIKIAETESELVEGITGQPFCPDDIPLVAMAPEVKLSESRLRMDQAIEREVQDAMTRKQFELVELMAKAGVPVNEFPDTPEGATQLQKWMDDHQIQIQRLVFEDNFNRSGTYVYRAGIEIGYVHAEIVRGVMI